MSTGELKNLFHFGIKGKLLLIFISLSAGITIIMSVVSYVSGSSAISHEVIAKLSAVAELKTTRLESYIETIYGEAHVMTGLDIIKKSSDLLITDIQSSDINPSMPLEDKRKSLMNSSQNYRFMSQYVKKYQEALHNYAEIKFVAISDITNRRGETVFREGDQIISTGGYTGNTKERSMFRGGMEMMMNVKKGVEADRYSCPLLYSSSIEHCGELNRTSIHMAHGIARSGVGPGDLKKNTPAKERFSLMMIFDVKIESIDALLTDGTGMGDTGESYLVEKSGDKLLMLTESRFEKDTELKKELTGIKSIEEHIKRNEHQRGSGICQNVIYSNYRGIDSISHNHILKIGDHDVALITEIGKSEVFAPISRLMMIMIILGGVVIGGSMILGIYFSGGISRPIKYSAGFTEKIAGGDLTGTVAAEFLDRRDELGDLARSLDRMSRDLNTLINGIITSSRNLAQAVDQIAAGNQNLSQRVSEQASALEEIASTVEEANSATKQNSSNAGEANKLSEDSFKLAEEGGRISLDAVSQINEISDVSKKIGEITNVINEISFQTNLLALNAAVEAARAGEAGRGFAVVAGEIRNLAQRSGNASKEINELIKNTITKIDKGTELVNRSGDSLINIITSIQKVSSIVKEISVSGREQEQGIEQINTALNEIDMMTQQNAALVEETASASEEMSSQARELIVMTERFKMADDSGYALIPGDMIDKKRDKI